MYDVSNIFINKFLIFLLVLVRMTSIFVISPVFSRKNMPTYLKIGLALFCTFIVVPGLEDINVNYYNLIDFSILIFKEFLVGILLGFVSFLVFSSLLVAGQIIDVQVGFGMVNIIDPINNVQVPLLGNFLYLLALNILLITNGHHIFLSALIKSYVVVPIDALVFSDVITNNLISIFVESFLIGFKIGIPIIAAVLLAEVSLGILARTVPQMNVLIIGLPLRIIVGLLSLIFILPAFASTLEYIFDKLYAFMSVILQSMAKG